MPKTEPQLYIKLKVEDAAKKPRIANRPKVKRRPKELVLNSETTNVATTMTSPVATDHNCFSPENCSTSVPHCALWYDHQSKAAIKPITARARSNLKRPPPANTSISGVQASSKAELRQLRINKLQREKAELDYQGYHQKVEILNKKKQFLRDNGAVMGCDLRFKLIEEIERKQANVEKRERELFNL